MMTCHVGPPHLHEVDDRMLVSTADALMHVLFAKHVVSVDMCLLTCNSLVLFVYHACLCDHCIETYVFF